MTKEINSLVLAYLGDTIYEDYIRRYLIKSGIGNVDSLQTESIKYVSAVNQSKFLLEMIDKSFFEEDELSIIKRARNYRGKTKPKNCDVASYNNATGLEALIGYLDLSNDKSRIEEIMNYIVGD